MKIGGGKNRRNTPNWSERMRELFEKLNDIEKNSNTFDFHPLYFQQRKILWKVQNPTKF